VVLLKLSVKPGQVKVSLSYDLFTPEFREAFGGYRTERGGRAAVTSMEAMLAGLAVGVPHVVPRAGAGVFTGLAEVGRRGSTRFLIARVRELKRLAREGRVFTPKGKTLLQSALSEADAKRYTHLASPVLAGETAMFTAERSGYRNRTIHGSELLKNKKLLTRIPIGSLHQLIYARR